MLDELGGGGVLLACGLLGLAIVLLFSCIVVVAAPIDSLVRFAVAWYVRRRLECTGALIPLARARQLRARRLAIKHPRAATRAAPSLPPGRDVEHHLLASGESTPLADRGSGRLPPQGPPRFHPLRPLRDDRPDGTA